MKQFTKGFFIGAGTVAATVAGALFGIKKTVIEPVEEEQKRIVDNSRKAMRKSRARS